MSFEEYWDKNWQPTGQPAVFDAAMREFAEKAWNAAVAATKESGAARCDEIAMKYQKTEGSYAAGKKAGAFECAEVLRTN